MSDRLQPGQVTALTSTVFSLASTAPAYSIAVSIGLLASLVGGHAPVLLLLSAVPVLGVVWCFAELNRAEPDCGTCYAWTSRAFGRVSGWAIGWISIAACVLVMSNLLQVAAIYAYTVVGAQALAGSPTAQGALGLVLLVVMAWLAYRGITVAARTQLVLFGLELAALVWFTVRAATAPALPITASGETWTVSGALAGFLVAVFLYWGWDSSFAVNEESDAPEETPQRSALTAVLVLALLYAAATWAALRYAGAARLGDIGEDDLFARLGAALLGSTGGTVLAGAILLSALASVQTTILPSARAAFAMARNADLPPQLRGLSKYGTPSGATWSFVAVSGLTYLALLFSSEDVLADSVAATALLVAAYYGATALAVPFYFAGQAWRRPLPRVVVPILTAAVFGATLVLAARDLSAVSIGTALAVALIGIAVPSMFSRPRRGVHTL